MDSVASGVIFFPLGTEDKIDWFSRKLIVAIYLLIKDSGQTTHVYTVVCKVC